MITRYCDQCKDRKCEKMNDPTCKHFEGDNDDEF